MSPPEQGAAPADGAANGKICPVPDEGPTDGDPVDLSTGLFTMHKTDLSVPGVFPLNVSRTYRPGDFDQSNFSYGTTLNVDLLLWSANQYQEVDLILPDGRRVHYVRNSPGVGFADAAYVHDNKTTGPYRDSTIVWNSFGWDLRLKDGTVYVFGVEAPLQEIRDRLGNRLMIDRTLVNEFGSQTGRVKRLRTSDGRWLAFTLDANERIAAAKDNLGRTVSYTYDAAGMLWKVTDVGGGVTEYTYDTYKRLNTIKDARGIVWLQNQYDVYSRVVTQTMADGGKFFFNYALNANGFVTQTDVTDPRGMVRRVTFYKGYTTSDSYAFGTPLQQTTLITRQTGTNLVLAQQDPLGRVVTYTYDSKGNVLQSVQLAGTANAVTTTSAYEPIFSRMLSQTNALGHTTLYEYDSVGQVIKTTDPLGHSSVYTYNAIGKMISTTNALGFTTLMTYTGVDLVAQQDPLGRVMSYFVDTGGRTVQVTDPLGRRTRSEYGPQNLMTKATDAQGNVTQMAYDLNGNLLNVTDARNSITRFEYDINDRVITRTDPLLNVDTYAYDLNGNLTQMKDRKGQATAMNYDLLNRRTQATFADGGVMTYTYDLVSRVQAITDTASGAITHTYDALNRLTGEATPLGAVGYGYDLIGRRTTLTVTNDTTTLYTYDNASRLTNMTKGAGTMAFGYDNANRRTSTTLPNGTVQSYGYDNASQMKAMTYTLGAATLGNLSYSYDNTGQRVQMGGSFARTALPQPIASASYDAGNRMLTWGAKTLSYDANGNLIGDGTNTYGWNARNQLSSISGGVSASFGYDAKNRRTNRTVNSVSVGYLHDGDNPVQEIRGSATNIWAGKTDEFFQRGNQTILRDALGSVIGLADANGAIATQYTYEPFGLASASGAASNNPFQFASRENDGTGLNYNRARYYSPGLGRFISQDSMGFGGGDVNWYAYARNTPNMATDPSGNGGACAVSDAQCCTNIGGFQICYPCSMSDSIGRRESTKKTDKDSDWPPEWDWPKSKPPSPSFKECLGKCYKEFILAIGVSYVAEQCVQSQIQGGYSWYEAQSKCYEKIAAAVAADANLVVCMLRCKAGK